MLGLTLNFTNKDIGSTQFFQSGNFISFLTNIQTGYTIRDSAKLTTWQLIRVKSGINITDYQLNWNGTFTSWRLIRVIPLCLRQTQ